MVDPCAKKRAHDKMKKVGWKGLKLAKILTAKLAAPFVLGAAKATAVASAIPIVMAAKGALIGKAIALPIKIMAIKTAALATGIAGLTVGVPVAIGTGIAAGAVGIKEKIKGMRKETCCQTPPCLSQSPCAAAGLPETDLMEGTDSPMDFSTPAEGMEESTGSEAPESSEPATVETTTASPGGPLTKMAEGALKELPKATAEALPKVAKEALPTAAKETLKALPKVAAETLPEVPSKGLAGAAAGALPKIAKEVLPAVAKEAVPKLAKEVLPKVAEAAVKNLRR